MVNHFSFVGQHKMGLHCARLPLKLTTKWKLLLFVLIAASFTVVTTLMCWSASTNIHIARRPKTLLINNNEQLCSTNTPLTHMYNRHRRWPTKSSAPTTSIVIVVPSRRDNFMQRRLIRHTYGSIRSMNNVNILAVVFILGSAEDQKDSKADPNALNSERMQFGDMIMGDLVDTYRNLSRKTIMTYDWLTSYCSEADLVVKTDDDVFVDIFKLTAELGKWTPAEFQSFKFWCGVHVPETVDRNPESIYYVAREEYSLDKFPKHCAGVGYVTSMNLVRRISDEISKSFRGPICSHEDVFMTGIVPCKMNSGGHNPAIEHVNKMSAWIFYVDEHNPNEGGEYIWRVAGEAVKETVDFDEFRQRSGTRVFYLLQHDAEFERKFLRLWYLAANSFRYEETKIKLDSESSV